MQRALALDASPPLGFALRFFVTAPLHVALSLIVIAYYGPEALQTRWHPAILAITHLLALGALAQTMFGAMLQILPVATGVHIIRSNVYLWGIYASLNAGTLCLALAFLNQQPAFFGYGFVLLLFAFGAFVGTAAWALWRDRQQITKGAPTILRAVRFALLSLLITLLLGLYLAGHLALSWSLPRQLTNLHAAWGLMGWVGLLLIGISFQVIPIFQVTERFPDPITRWLAAVIFAGLLGLSLLTTSKASGIMLVAVTTAIFTAYAIYGGVGLYLLYHRKRPQPDVTTLFWRTCFLSFFIIFGLWLASSYLGDAYPIILGFTALFGVGWSAINGMLYTILPFLFWYNAQRHAPVVIRSLPKVRHYLPDQQAKPQFFVHLLNLILWLATLFGFSLMLYPAIVFGLLSLVWLYRNIWYATRNYQAALALIQRTVDELTSHPSSEINK